ncbi:MAG: hypothetical protein FWB97_03835 [Oscillospiraceae bacterium]|nr:hypothetical protein [Oscillospiraceae bacterium]
MLKAYSYIENEQLDSGIVDRQIFDKERQIILEFALNNPTPKMEKNCVFCNGATKDFATIDNVFYQRCKACFSIFANVDAELLKRYKAYEPLVDFRSSSEYQNSAAERRKEIWNDFLFWLEYRVARHLRKTSALDVIDVGNFYNAFSEKVKKATFCGSYNTAKAADIVLFLDHFRCLADPMDTLVDFWHKLKDDGILVMGVRVGSGFDIITLKDRLYSIYPYETLLLPSTEGLSIMLNSSGFDVLEISTPGTLDVEFVLQNKEFLDESDLFVHYLLNKTDQSILAEFQRFLQKSGMSSHARIIARKRAL